MKTKIFYTCLLAMALLTVFGLKAQTVTGLKWMKTFYSTGLNATPGFVYDSSSIFMPVNFSDTLRFEAGGAAVSLGSAGDGDLLLARFNGQSGILNLYRHLMSKSHLVATAVTLFDGHLQITGACRDSVFMTADSGNRVYLGGKPGPEKGFIVSLNTGLNFISFTTPAAELVQSGLNLTEAADPVSVSVGTARPDSVSGTANMVVVNNNGSYAPVILDTLTRAEIQDAAFFNGFPWVGGSFADSLLLPDTTLVSISGTQAFVARVQNGPFPYTKAVVWRCYQHATVAGMAAWNGKLWVAVNFADSLMLPGGQRLSGKGMSDGVIMQYDTAFNLLNTFQFGGSYSERIDKLFVSNNTLFVLANTASPDTRVWKNGTESLTVTQAENKGIQTLLTISPGQVVHLEWTAPEGRLGRMTGVHKISGAETLLAGTFINPMVIDNDTFTPQGSQDVYLLRIADECINRMKKSNITLAVCQGDSITLAGAYLVDSSRIVLHADSGSLVIKQPGKYFIKLVTDCGCDAADTLEVVMTDGRGLKQAEAEAITENSVITLTDKSTLAITYCGQCGQKEAMPRFSVRPNPSRADVRLYASLPKAATLSIRVVNAEGQGFAQQQLQLPEGEHSVSLHAENWPSGTYWIHITHNDGTAASSQIFPFIKQ